MSGTIAYLAGSFPKRSETFVYREVRELRRRGWNVRAISLNEPEDRDAPELADLRQDLMMVYGSQSGATISAAFGELVLHPLRSLRTLATAIGDAIVPAEPLSLGNRLKLLAQAWMAI